MEVNKEKGSYAVCQVFHSGNFAYEFIKEWEKWPSDMENPTICGIACTKDGNVVAAPALKSIRYAFWTGRGI